MISNPGINVNNYYDPGQIAPNMANKELGLSQVQELLSDQYTFSAEIANSLSYLETRLELVLSYKGESVSNSSKNECGVKSVPEPPLVASLRFHNELLVSNNKKIQELISRLAI